MELHRARSESLRMRPAASVLRPDPSPSADLDAENTALHPGPRRLDGEHLRPIEADHDVVAEGHSLRQVVQVVVGASEPTRWQFEARDLVFGEEPSDGVHDRLDDWSHAIIMLSARESMWRRPLLPRTAHSCR